MRKKPAKAPKIKGTPKTIAPLIPLDQAAFFLPLYSTAMSILRNKTENRVAIPLGKSELTPRFQQLGDLFVLEKNGNRYHATPTLETAKTRAQLMKRNSRTDTLMMFRLVDVFLFSGLIAKMPPEIADSIDIQCLKNESLGYLGESLGKYALKVYKGNVDEIEAASKSARSLSEMIYPHIKRMREGKGQIGNSDFGHSAYAIEVARVLCEELHRLPTKSEVYEKMISNGWKLGKVSDPKHRWKEILMEAGLTKLDE